MKTVVIDFLDDAGHQDGSYRKAIFYLSAYAVYECAVTIDVFLKIAGLNTDSEPLIVTFFGHGNLQGIGKYVGQKHYRLLYSKLLPALNKCRTKFPLYVNLIANCDSYGVGRYLKAASEIDEFWVTTDKTYSIGKACLAANDIGNSDIFLELNKSETRKQYAKYIHGQFMIENDN
jgi:hypothetical protein